MGWNNEQRPGCEGYLVGFVHHVIDGREAQGLYRELSYAADDGTTRTDIRRLAAACECGWRSPNWKPIGYGVRWSPCIITAPEADEERAYQAWKRHTETPMAWTEEA